MENNIHSVYFLKCADDTIYCGYTNNLPQRVKTHNAGKGAKYTHSRLPVVLVYFENYEDKSAALKREYQLKKIPRKTKLEMIDNFKGELE